MKIIKFNEWAESSSSQQTFAKLVANWFRHYLLNCITFYTFGPRAPHRKSGRESRDAHYHFYPRAPRPIVTPLFVIKKKISASQKRRCALWSCVQRMPSKVSTDFNRIWNPAIFTNQLTCRPTVILPHSDHQRHRFKLCARCCAP